MRRNLPLALLLVLGLAASVFASTLSAVAEPDTSSTMQKIGMANPAAVYCEQLGYARNIVKDYSGEHGECTFPDKTKCEEWQFLVGKCGQSYSYCAKQGYGIKTMSDGKDGFSKEYAVCVSADKTTELGSVSKLFDLGKKSVVGKMTIPASTAPTATSESTTAVTSTTSYPSYFDWRNYDGGDWMTPVKDQLCGNCWAYSAVGVAEAAYNLFMDNPNYDLDLSEEYLSYECTSGTGGTCGGGNPGVALDFIKGHGVPDGACIQYSPNLDCKNLCADWQSRLVKINRTGGVPRDKELVKKYLIEKGPLSVTMFMGIGGPDDISYWDGDIYRCHNAQDSNHAVVLVGYNDTGNDSTSYWIIKNSWGVDWPPPNGGGYFKIGFGECDILSMVFFAIRCRGATASCNSHSQCCSGRCEGGVCALSDLAVQDVSFLNPTTRTIISQAHVGDLVTLSGTIKNNGPATSPESKARVVLDDPTTRTYFLDNDVIVPELSPGSTFVVEINPTISCSTSDRLTIAANPDEEYEESNKMNNAGSATIVVTPACGDNCCNSDENYTNCPGDCPCDQDNICDSPRENGINCASDCGCNGNGICEPARGEGFGCPDCSCGDNFCDKARENATTCPQDCNFTCGDMNNDSIVNVNDVVRLIDYVFRNGPPPIPYPRGDVNLDYTIDVRDAVYLIDYTFRNGPEPCKPPPGLDMSQYIGYTYEQVMALMNSTYCGDGNCNGNETCSSCQQDCGSCSNCTPRQYCTGSNIVERIDANCKVSTSSCGSLKCCNGQCSKSKCAGASPETAPLSQVQGPPLDGKERFLLGIISLVLLAAVVFYSFIRIETDL